MRAVVQRVRQGSVIIDGRTVGAIGQGLVVLLAVARGDTGPDADYLAEKIVNLRIFEDEGAKMNRCLAQVGGKMLVVSQFTLLGDCRKGRRPSFIAAAAPEEAEVLYNYFVEKVRKIGITAATGQFGANMQVALVNDGPVTLILESTPKIP